MGNDVRRIDPEVLALLRDGNADSEVPLLVARSLSDLRGYEEFRQPKAVIKKEKVKRHLLQVHREEVAWLLRQASGIAMQRHPQSMLATYANTDEHFVLPDEDSLRKRAAGLRDVANGLGANEVDALRGLLGLMPIAFSSASRLAEASLDLLPRDDTRLYLALALIHEQNHQPAFGLLKDVLDRNQYGMDAAMAWTNLATLYHQEGAFGEAQDAARNATEIADQLPALVNWLGNSCLVADRMTALEVARRIDERLPPNHPASEEYTAILAKTAHSSACKHTVLTFQDQLGPTCRRLLDVDD